MEEEKSSKVLAIVIIIATIVFFVGVNDIRKLEDKNEQLLEEKENLLNEYVELQEQVDNYFSALNRANEDIDLANFMIDEAKSYSGESCKEMKQALDDLFKIDVIDMEKNNLKIPSNFR